MKNNIFTLILIGILLSPFISFAEGGNNVGMLNDSVSFFHGYLGIEATMATETTYISTAETTTSNTRILVEVTFGGVIKDKNFNISDISVTNGDVSEITPDIVGSNVTTNLYTFYIKPQNEGDIIVNVKDHSGGGDSYSESNQLTITFNASNPEPVITFAESSPTIASQFVATVTFSEAVSGFTSSDITFINATITDFASNSTSDVYTFSLFPQGYGNVTVNIAANICSSALYNIQNTATSKSIFYDKMNAYLNEIRAVNGTTTTNLSEFLVEISFTGDIKGFENNDITVTNGSGSFINNGPRLFYYLVKPTIEGVVTLSFAANTYSDDADTPNAVTGYFSFTYDASLPQPSITLSKVFTNLSTVQLTIDFGETVGGFSTTSLSGIGAQFAEVSNNGQQYVYNMSAYSSGNYTIGVAANAATDRAGNYNIGTNAAFTFDNVQPTPTIRSPLGNATNSAAIPLVIDFGEAVSGLSTTNIAASSGTVVIDGHSGNLYFATLTANVQGLITVALSSSAASDAAGNASNASNIFSISYNTSNPSAIISSLQAPATNASAAVISVTFSENISNLTIADFVLTNGSISNFMGSDALYTFNFTPSTANTTTKIFLPQGVCNNGSGNTNLEASIDIIFDNIRPTASITTTSTNPTNQSVIYALVSFSEDISSSDVSNNINVTNCTYTSNWLSKKILQLEVTPTIASGTITLEPNNTFYDAAANQSIAQNVLSITVDAVNPIATISTLSSLPSKETTIAVTIAFSEAVFGFESSELFVSNAAIANFYQSGGIATFNLTANGNGTVNLWLNNGVCADAAGNPNNSAFKEFLFDSDVPKPLISSVYNTITTSQSIIPVTVDFGELVSPDPASLLVSPSATVGAFTHLGNGVYTCNITVSTDGSYTVSVAANVVSDAAGNYNLASSNVLTFTYDSSPVVPTISTNAVSPTRNIPVAVYVDFSEAVIGLTSADFVLSSGTMFNFWGSGQSYRFDLSFTQEGEVTIGLPANRCFDAVGNANNEATTLSVTYDSVLPIPVVSSTSQQITNISPVPFTIDFGEQITNFNSTDIAVSGGTLSVVYEVVSNKRYDILITPTSSVVDIAVHFPANKVKDLAGNNNEISNNLIIKYDEESLKPEIAFSSDYTTINDTLAYSSVSLTFNFNKIPVYGFTIEDVSVSNATKDVFTSDGSSYFNLTITPDINKEVTVSVASGVCSDNAYAVNITSNLFRFWHDIQRPTPVLSVIDVSPSNNYPLSYTVDFGENITNFYLEDVSVTNGNLAGNPIRLSEGVYRIKVNPTADGVVTAYIMSRASNDQYKVTDIAGNINFQSNTVNITYDNTPPTPVVSPLTVASITKTNLSNIDFEINFGEHISSFTTTDLNYTNIDQLRLSTTDDKIYTLNISLSTDGAVSFDIPTGSCSDDAGNYNSLATYSFLFDKTGSKPTISTTEQNPTNATAVIFTIKFDEEVVNFSEVADINVDNGTVLSNSIKAIDFNNAIYTVEINPTNDGEVSVSVNAAICEDTYGNSNTASAVYTFEYDKISPVASIYSPMPNPTNIQLIQIYTQFTDVNEIENFDISDISIIGATLSGSLVEINNKLYSYNIVPNSTFENIDISIAANRFVDKAGNYNDQEAVFSIQHDRTPVTVQIGSAEVDYTNSNPIPLTITLNKKVNGFAVGDISATNGSLSAFTTVSDTEYTVLITPDTDSIRVYAEIMPGKFFDDAGNFNLQSNVYSIIFDRVRPQSTLTILSDLNYYDNYTDTDIRLFTNVLPLDFEVDFGEDIKSFNTLNLVHASNHSYQLIATNNRIFSFSINAIDQGDIVITIPSGIATDLSGNSNSNTSVVSFVYDITKPIPTIASALAPETNVVSIPFDIGFTEIIHGFSTADVVITAKDITNGIGTDTYTTTMTQFLKISEKEYSILIEPDNKVAKQLVTVSIPSNVCSDRALNGNTAVTFTIVFDLINPLPEFIPVSRIRTYENPIQLIIDFTKNVTNFEAADISVTNASISHFSGLNDLYSVNLTPDFTEGTIFIDIPEGVCSDDVMNPNKQAVISFYYDEVIPIPTIIGNNTPTNKRTIPISIMFAEEVNGFTTADLNIVNGYVNLISPPNPNTKSMEFILDLHPLDIGFIEVYMAENKVQDLALNYNLPSINTFEVWFDDSQPTASVTIDDATYYKTKPFTNKSLIIVDIGFSKEIDEVLVKNYYKNKIAANIATLELKQNAGDKFNHELHIQPKQDYSFFIDLPSGITSDIAGNFNVDANAIVTIIYDNTAAVPTLINNYTLTNDAYLSIPLWFNEPVATFNLNNYVDNALYSFEITNYVDVANTTKQYFDKAVLTLKPNTNYSGETNVVTIQIPENSFTDRASNSNTSSNKLAIEYDYIEPIPLITPIYNSSTNVDQSATNGTVTLSITFTEDVVSFDSDDISLINASIQSFKQLTPKVYSVLLMPIVSDKPCSATIIEQTFTDRVGNKNRSASYSIYYDATLPQATILSVENTQTSKESFTVELAFSEAIKNLLVDDFTISSNIGATLQAASQYNIFSVNIPVADVENEIISISIAQGKFTDNIDQPYGSANSNLPTAIFTIEYDNHRPTPLISLQESYPLNDEGIPETNENPIPVLISFTEAMVDLKTTDFTIGNASMTLTKISANIYSANIIPAKADDVITLMLADGQVFDLALNLNYCSNLLKVSYDSIRPVPQISSNEQVLTKSLSYPVEVSFSYPVYSFEVNDLAVENAIITDFTKIDRANYSFNIAPLNDGVVELTVTENSIFDLAENPNRSAYYSILFDGTRPKPTLIESPKAYTNDGKLFFTFDFGEAIINYDAYRIAEFSSGLNVASVNKGIVKYSLELKEDQILSININEAICTDLAGNTNLPFDVFEIDYDILKPIPSIYSAEQQATNNNPVAMYVVFNEQTSGQVEEVLGFELHDIFTINGEANELQKLSAGLYSFNFYPEDDGMVEISVKNGSLTDRAQNPNLGTTSPYKVEFDQTLPEITIYTPEYDHTVSNPLLYRILFSEPVSGLAVNDIQVVNGTIMNFEIQSNMLATFNIVPDTPGARERLEVVVTIPDAAVIDKVDNANIATSHSIIYQTYLSPCSYVNNGIVNTNTIWDKDIVQIDCDLTIESNAILTIAAGTSVEFLGDYSITVSGKLIVENGGDTPTTFAPYNTSHWAGLKFVARSEGVFDNCKISGIDNLEAGAISLFGNSNVSFVNAVIENNKAINGGGIHLSNQAKLTLENTLLHNNAATSNGGAIYMQNDAFVDINNAIFSNNIAELSGGAVFCMDDTEAVVSTATFTRNTALENGGVFDIEGKAKARLNKLIINNNAAQNGGAIYASEHAQLDIEKSTIKDNDATQGGAMYFTSTDKLTLSHNHINNNTASDIGGAIVFDAVNPVDACVLSNNVLTNNHAAGDYAAISFNNSSKINFINNTIAHNTSTVGHSAYINNSSPLFSNDILWAANSSLMKIDGGAVPTFTYCNIKGGLNNIEGKELLASSNYLYNIDFNPEFISTDSYKINTTSPCINTGKPSTEMQGFDFEGNIRNFGRIDIGAVEIQQEPLKIFVNGEIISDTEWCNTEVCLFGDVKVLDGVTLTICAGTKVNVLGYYNILVAGGLQAVGLPSNSITFTGGSNEGWNGISFVKETVNDKSTIEHALIENSHSKASGGGVWIDGVDNLKINKTTITNCSALSGGALAIKNASPNIANNLLEYNNAKQYGGAVFLMNSNTKLSDNKIIENSANDNSSSNGGGIYINGGRPNLLRNFIANNKALQYGGAIGVEDVASATIQNNVLVNNEAKSGGAIHLLNSTASIESNTVANNSGAGFVFDTGATADIINNILYGNVYGQDKRHIITDPSNKLIVEYNCIDGGETAIVNTENSIYSIAFDKSMNLNCSPSFISPTTVSGNGAKGYLADWQLNVVSPCVNAGFTIDSNATSASDMNNDSRLYNNSRIDIGAYETTAEFNYGDMLALIDLYKTTNGDNWTTDEPHNWKSEDTNWETLNPAIVNWEGVTVEGGRVTEINLSGLSLSGKISDKIGDLKFLKKIILYNNNLSGTLPSAITNLYQLTTINANKNKLTGFMPEGIGRLSNLSSIQLNNNLLSGALTEEINQLENLIILDVNGNNLSDLPLYLPSKLINLQLFSVQNNRFEFDDIYKNLEVTAGFQYSPQQEINTTDTLMIKERGKAVFTTLAGGEGNSYSWQHNGSMVLSNSSNNIYAIEDAYLRDAGNYSCEVINPNVPGLTLVRRNIHLIVDTLKIESTDFNPLLALYHATDGANWTNKWDLNGNPNDWYGIVVVRGRVVDIDLSNNNLNGYIPDSMKYITKLEKLNLKNNQLSGKLPQSIGELSLLQNVDLSSNALNGSLPSSIGALTVLRNLDLSSNKFTDTIPADIGNLKKLELLNLSQNKLEGDIPSSLSNLTVLTKLLLNNNLLSNSLPKGINQLSQLNEMNLSLNKLSGPLSEELFTLTNLVNLSLAGNLFSGTLSANVNQLNKLATLDISGNQLSGGLPFNGSLQKLSDLRLSGNNFNGTLNAELFSLTTLKILLLANNNFNGTISEAIQQLEHLELLDISSNNFSGALPDGILQLKALKELDLHHNKINTMPDLSVIEKLTELNVSSNNLTIRDLLQAVPVSIRGDYIYEPQDTIFFDTQYLTPGENRPITIDDLGTNYEWLLNNISLSTSSATHTITDASTNDFGYYNCNVTHSSLPLIKLHYQIPVIIDIVPDVDIPQPYCMGDKLFTLIENADTLNLTYWYKVVDGNEQFIKHGNIYHDEFPEEADELTVVARYRVANLESKPRSITLRLRPTITEDNGILSVSPYEGASYQWFKNDQLLEGATAATININQYGDGQYKVTLINNTCSATSRERTVSGGILSIGKEEMKRSIYVFPNPTDDMFSLVIDDFIGSVPIVLRDLTGRKILSKTVDVNSTSNVFDFDIKGLSHGFYLLEVGEGKNRNTLKIIKR